MCEHCQKERSCGLLSRTHPTMLCQQRYARHTPRVLGMQCLLRPQYTIGVCVCSLMIGQTHHRNVSRFSRTQTPSPWLENWSTGPLRLATDILAHIENPLQTVSLPIAR